MTLRLLLKCYIFINFLVDKRVRGGSRVILLKALACPLSAALTIVLVVGVIVTTTNMRGGDNVFLLYYKGSSLQPCLKGLNLPFCFLQLY